MSPGRALGAVSLAALLLLGAGLLIARQAPQAPSLAECASLWNSATNTASRNRAASSPAAVVVLDSSMNKAGQGGCSVTVIEGAAGPWTAFATTLVQLRQFPGQWDVQSGQRWGTDSPAPQKAANATLRPDGTVVLATR